jgi:hypothetical protein
MGRLLLVEAAAVVATRHGHDTMEAWELRRTVWEGATVSRCI